MGDPLYNTNMGLATAAAQTAGPARETDTGILWGCWTPSGGTQRCSNFHVWFQPTAAPPGTNGPANGGFGGAPDTVEVYSGNGVTQPIPDGHHTPSTSPTDADVADALRRQLTAPGDTCLGSACPWGDNGGSPEPDTAHLNSTSINCVIADNCNTTPLSPNYALPDCTGYTVADCESLVSAASATVHDSPPSFSVSSVDPASQDTAMMPGSVLSQDVAGGTLGHPDNLTLTANPDPMNGFSSGGGYGGGGDSTTSSDPPECDFDEYAQPPTWRDASFQYPDFYDAACEEGWQYAQLAGLVDGLDEPTSWVETAQVALRGKYFRNPALVDLLESDGSSVTDWAKVKSPQFDTPYGKAEMHVYKNLVTGQINTAMDWKLVFQSIFYP